MNLHQTPRFPQVQKKRKNVEVKLPFKTHEPLLIKNYDMTPSNKQKNFVKTMAL